MAKQASAATAKPNAIQRLKTFFSEVHYQMSQVAWPSRDELKQSTSIVLMVLCIFAVIIGIMDQIFSALVFMFLGLG